MPGITIAEAARQTGISAHTLRYYERIGLLDRVARDGDRRRFDADDLARVEFLRCLRATGMPIRRMREYVDLVRQGSTTNDDRRRMLEDHRDTVLAEIDQLHRELAVINRKIDMYHAPTGNGGPKPWRPPR
jgi:DNA-binding transcriptional MerR regulator